MRRRHLVPQQEEFFDSDIVPVPYTEGIKRRAPYKEAVIHAVCCGSAPTVTFLLNNGVDVNTKNDFGYTLLMLAVINCHADMIELLIEWGADVNAQDQSGSKAFDYAFDFERGAYWMGDVASFSMLFDRTDNIKAKSIDKHALIWATKHNFPELVRTLLHSGVPVDAKDWRGKTAFIWACREGNALTMRYLWDAGAGINVKDNYGKNALINALQLRNSLCTTRKSYDHINSIIPLLLKYQADVNAIDKAGNTPLSLAVTNPDNKIFASLIAHGAYIKIHREKLEGLARLYGQTQKLEMIRKAGA